MVVVEVVRLGVRGGFRCSIVGLNFIHYKGLMNEDSDLILFRESGPTAAATALRAIITASIAVCAIGSLALCPD